MKTKEIIADGPVSRILRLGSKAHSEQSTYRKQRTYAVSDVNCVSRARITGTRWTHLLCGLLLLLFVSVASAQEQHRTFRIPFHSVNGMILLDATVNNKPAVLLLDTGADFTLISPQASGLSTVKLRALTGTKTTGANGDYVKSRVDLRLAERHWIEREILVMDLSDASKRLGTRVDGFVGQDLLQEFSAVRIDFKNHVVELESAR